VIIPPKDYGAWLDVNAEEPMRFLRPYPAARMAARPVSMRVNQPANDDPTLIEETSEPLQRGLL
jgi:putative SOS response-associated peptidase YedK